MEQIDRHGIGADIGQEGDLPCGNTHQEKDQPQQGGADAQQAETPAVISRLIGYGAIQPGVLNLIHILRDHINQGAEQSAKAECENRARRSFPDPLFQGSPGRARFSCCFRLSGRLPDQLFLRFLPIRPFPIVRSHQEIGEKFHNSGKGEVIARLIIKADQNSRQECGREHHSLFPPGKAASLNQGKQQIPGDTGEQIPQKPVRRGELNLRFLFQHTVGKDQIKNLENHIRIDQVVSDLFRAVPGKHARNKSKKRHMKGIDDQINHLEAVALSHEQLQHMPENHCKDQQALQVIHPVIPFRRFCYCD